MKNSELEDIIFDELSENELFNKLFKKLDIYRYDYGRIFCINIRFIGQMIDDYFDEDGDYDWDKSSREYEELLHYVINVVKKIVSDKVKILNYEDYEVDGPDLYINFEDTTISDDE